MTKTEPSSRVGVAFNTMLCIVVIVGNACTQAPKSDDGNNELSTSENTMDSVPFRYDTAQENSEYLDWDLLKIEGKLPMLCLKTDLIKILGAPDSIVKPDMNELCVTYFQDNVEYAYFAGSKFDIAQENAAVASLNLKNVELTYEARQMVLNGFTTLDDIKDLFPKAFKEKRQSDVIGLGKTILISVPISKTNFDDSWHLFFVDGRLKRIDFWMPC